MRVVEIGAVNMRVEGFPTPLIKWQKKKKYLNSALSNFKKYKEENRAVIVHSPRGWSIYTDTPVK